MWLSYGFCIVNGVAIIMLRIIHNRNYTEVMVIALKISNYNALTNNDRAKWRDFLEKRELLMLKAEKAKKLLLFLLCIAFVLSVNVVL
jgi:hypothetical protein